MAEVPTLESQFNLDYRTVQRRLQVLAEELEEARRRVPADPVSSVPTDSPFVEQLKQRLAEAEQTRDQMKTEADRFRHERDESRKQLTESGHEQSNRLAELVADVAALKSQLVEKDALLVQLRSRGEKLESQLKEAQNNVGELTRQLEKCRQEQHDSVSGDGDVVRKLKSQIAQLEKARDVANAHAQSSLTKYAQLRNQFDAKLK